MELWPHQKGNSTQAEISQILSDLTLSSEDERNLTHTRFKIELSLSTFMNHNDFSRTVAFWERGLPQIIHFCSTHQSSLFFDLDKADSSLHFKRHLLPLSGEIDQTYIPRWLAFSRKDKWAIEKKEVGFGSREQPFKRHEQSVVSWIHSMRCHWFVWYAFFHWKSLL